MSFRHVVRLFCSSLVACAAALSVTLPAPTTNDPHLFVITSDLMRGNSSSLELDSPWSANNEIEPVGTQAWVRHFFGRHYVVNVSSADVQVIDPGSMDTILT